jgi:hypothetical protein
MALAAAGLTGLVLAAPAHAANTNPQTYTAPVVVSGTADPVSSVVVSNDAGGTIRIAVNLSAALASTDSIGVWIDADSNPATGDRQTAGAEYALGAELSDNSVDLGAWNGSSWNNAPSAATLQGSHTDTQQTFTINRSELGNTSAFNFWVDSCDGDCSAGHDSQVPVGTWNYQLQIPSSVKLLSPALLAPKTAKAGKRYTAAMIVQPSDPSISFADQGQVACKATIAGKSVRAVATIVTATFQGTMVSAAVCDVQVGKSAHGKRLVGTITARYGSARASRTFNAKVM